MATPERHFREEIQDLLDGRLDAATRAEVERHLATCAECRRELEVLRWTKEMARRQLSEVAAPTALRDRIVHALEAEPAPASAPAAVRRAPRTVWWLVAGAAMAAAVVVAVLWLRARPVLPDQVAREFEAFHDGRLTLVLQTDKVDAMAAYFVRQGVPFKPRVFDLGMMQYRLQGGWTAVRHGKPSAVFIYRGPAGQVLMCEMFLGRVTDLPAGAARRRAKGIDFYVYRAGGLTEVFWPEGEVICVLVSDIPPENVVQLAFAKAMPP